MQSEPITHYSLNFLQQIMIFVIISDWATAYSFHQGAVVMLQSFFLHKHLDKDFL